ncbi:MAG TPA: hypothetical protein VGM39_20020 [Kofleriaceae bacterium]|jgi:hypothetical protein
MKLHAVLLSLGLAASTAFAQGSAAGSGSADAGPGSAASAAASDQKAAPDTAKARKACEAAVANPPGGDTRFITDAQWASRGYLSTAQLAKSTEGQACLEAIAGFDDLRSTLSTAADKKAADDLVAEAEASHAQAAHAIAKNEKHVVLAYGALWLLAAGFLLFLWRRQQDLKTEIAQLKRDLDAATK